MPAKFSKPLYPHLIRNPSMPRAPISTADVGVIMLVNPSPNWIAITVACLESPITSENGAIIGMVRAAFAEPEV